MAFPVTVTDENGNVVYTTSDDDVGGSAGTRSGKGSHKKSSTSSGMQRYFDQIGNELQPSQVPVELGGTAQDDSPNIPSMIFNEHGIEVYQTPMEAASNDALQHLGKIWESKHRKSGSSSGMQRYFDRDGNELQPYQLPVELGGTAQTYSTDIPVAIFDEHSRMVYPHLVGYSQQELEAFERSLGTNVGGNGVPSAYTVERTDRQSGGAGASAGAGRPKYVDEKGKEVGPDDYLLSLVDRTPQRTCPWRSSKLAMGEWRGLILKPAKRRRSGSR